MKKPAILFSLFVIVSTTRAQEVIPQKASVPDFKKNEISINTAPFFKILLNTGAEQSTRFSVTYKRNLKNNRSAFRFSLMADKIQDYSYNEKAVLREFYNMREEQYVTSPSYWSPHINIGYERHFGKKKLQWFYGADLLIGYFENKSITQYYKTYIDTTSSGAIGLFEEYQKGEDRVLKKETFSVGISPFFGAKYPISKRFFISAQVGADITYQDQRVAETKSGVTKNYRVSTFDFNQSTGILNDISLIYRF